MSEIEAIVGETKQIHDGDAWHGPSLVEILADVSAGQAAAKPISAAHSIWELVLHIAVWEKAFIRRLEGHPATVSDADNFPQFTEASEEAWRRTLAYLNDSHADLLSAISKLTDEALDETAVGTDYSIRFMLRGAVRHSVYHAGQILLLKRAITDLPDERHR